MSERTPQSDVKPDIHYSIKREEPRATFMMPEVFVEDSYTYENVFVNELLVEHQPYEINENSPTPLDPWHLRMHKADYVPSASVYMENRLIIAADEIGLADEHREIIMNEISHEHILRSNRNNEAMRRIRASVDPDQPVDPVTAELILKARAGVATLEEAAYLLAAYPQAEGIEVMKYTGPLIDRIDNPTPVVDRHMNKIIAGTKFDVAELQFADALQQISQNQSGIIVDTSTRMPQRPRNSDGYGIRNVIVTKAKESDLYICSKDNEPIHIESVGRYSYYVPNAPDEALRKVRPTVARINGKPVVMYPIALSKYLRVVKSTSGQ